MLDRLDLVLVMTVNPGFGGQEFIPRRSTRSAGDGDDRRPRLRIEVDGGIAPETAPIVVAAGADTLVAGSAVFHGGSSTYAANLAAIHASLGGVDRAA